MTIGSATSVQQSARPTAAPPPPATARAADGDYLTKGAGHMVKDADGDYKANAPGSSAAAPAVTVSTAVQAALTSLTKGG